MQLCDWHLLVRSAVLRDEKRCSACHPEPYFPVETSHPLIWLLTVLIVRYGQLESYQRPYCLKLTAAILHLWARYCIKPTRGALNWSFAKLARPSPTHFIALFHPFLISSSVSLCPSTKSTTNRSTSLKQVPTTNKRPCSSTVGLVRGTPCTLYWN